MVYDQKAQHPWRDTKNDTEKINALFMKGADVYEFACNAMVETIEVLKEKLGRTINKIIPHQANGRIIKYAAHKSKVPIKNFFVNIQKYANTSGRDHTYSNR